MLNLIIHFVLDHKNHEYEVHIYFIHQSVSNAWPIQNTCKNWVQISTDLIQLCKLKWKSILTKLGLTQKFKGFITSRKYINIINLIYRLKKSKYTVIAIEEEKYLIIINIQ